MDNDHASTVGDGLSTNAENVDTGNLSARELISASIASLAHANGFALFWVGTFPSADNPGLIANRIADNWPEDLAHLYDTTAGFYASKLVGLMRDTIIARFFDTSAFDANGKVPQQPVSLTFSAYGFQHSLGLAIYDASGERYLIILSGKAIARCNLAAIQYDIARSIDTFRQRSQACTSPQRKLAKREVECLRWAAAGKSSEEIATILQLSPHTVNFYLAAATRKLQCSNRMHAIARALRQHLI